MRVKQWRMPEPMNLWESRVRGPRVGPLPPPPPHRHPPLPTHAAKPRMTPFFQMTLVPKISQTAWYRGCGDPSDRDSSSAGTGGLKIEPAPSHRPGTVALGRGPSGHIAARSSGVTYHREGSPGGRSCRRSRGCCFRPVPAGSSWPSLAVAWPAASVVTPAAAPGTWSTSVGIMGFSRGLVPPSSSEFPPPPPLLPGFKAMLPRNPQVPT